MFGEPEEHKSEEPASAKREQPEDQREEARPLKAVDLGDLALRGLFVALGDEYGSGKKVLLSGFSCQGMHEGVVLSHLDFITN